MKLNYRLLKFFCFLGRFVFSLRYEVKIKGKELLEEKIKKNQGILVLPNHPAHVDPILIILHFWPILNMRPLVIEYMYRKPLVHFFMKMIGALPVPDFESSINDLKIEKGKEVFKKIQKDLKKKKCFMLYPAGRIKHGAKEIIGGASATSDLLQKNPGINIVLVRTIGLWGSIFSRALTKKSPDLMTNIYRGIKIALKNLIFFTPRRKVCIEIEVNPKDFPRKTNRLDLNRYLENWYNQYPSQKKKGQILDAEPLVLVTHTFYKKSYPKIEEETSFYKKTYLGKISRKKQKEIYQYLANLSQMDVKQIEHDMSLALDLGLDSLDIASCVSFLSDHYDTGNIHPEDLETVKDVLEIAEGRLKGIREETFDAKNKWPKEKNRPQSAIPEGKTLLEAFFRICNKMKSFSACADDVVGVMSYNQLKKSVIILALEFRKKQGKYQGILLPASVGAYLCIFASLLAGKIPVMLNWSLGSRYLNQMIKLTKTKNVFSSWRFLERLTHVELGDLKKHLTLLEDLRKNISIFTKLKGLMLSFLSVKSLFRIFSFRNNPKNTAVVLFTSGTEAMPKGVPLSHMNILKNLQSAMQCISIKKSDILLGILPPFHSFGFTVAGIFPILAGVKIAFSPDPTDSFALLSSLQRWKATIFCSAPSFILGLCQAVQEAKQVSSLRLVVTGAEKAPAVLFSKMEKLNKKARIIEGYGITECSPIISLQRIGKKRVGVGQILPDVEIITIHPETSTPLKKGENGELCVLGPNVFEGYLGKVRSPFVTVNNKKYYRTGDLGYVDKKNHIILSGRLKRFAKIGGEMVSLGALEEELNKSLFSQKDLEKGPQIAICMDEKDETKTSLVLFTTLKLDVKKVNEILKEKGFSRLIKINIVKTIDEIPILNAGKVDYRGLQALISE